MCEERGAGVEACVFSDWGDVGKMGKSGVKACEKWVRKATEAGRLFSAPFLPFAFGRSVTQVFLSRTPWSVMERCEAV